MKKLTLLFSILMTGALFGATWKLSNDDVRISITVSANKLYIDTLINPVQNWSWTPVSAEVPLISNVVVNSVNTAPTWVYQDATVDSVSGMTVTLRFTSATPNLELKSIWRVRPGVGPVEHKVTIKNNNGGNVVLNGYDIYACDLNVVADSTVKPFRADTVSYYANGYNVSSSSGNFYGQFCPLPYEIIQVGSKHGLYLAYDYDYGTFHTVKAVNPLNINSKFWVGHSVNTTVSNGETFRCPGIFIETYKGDEDDGSNHFKKWFWNYEVPASLRNNPSEPPIEVCNGVPQDGDVDLLISQANTGGYANWGVNCMKTDYWYRATGWSRSDELAAALHANGMMLTLYYDGYISEAALKAEYDKSHFDIYRSDALGFPAPYTPFNYHAFMDYNQKIDNMFAYVQKDPTGAPKWRLENCCNGGNIRSLDVCRRMTFMTHSDPYGTLGWVEWFFNNIYNWSYMINPIQLKNDYGFDKSYPTSLNDSKAYVRAYLLGAVLTGSLTDSFFISSIPRVREVLRLYNEKQRTILRGANVYHILPWPVTNNWFGLQYFNTDINKGTVLLWQNGGPASKTIKLKGLDRSATYTLAFEDDKSLNTSMTGAQLMDVGVAVSIGVNSSEIIWINSVDPSADTLFYTQNAGSANPPAQNDTIHCNGGPAFNAMADSSWVTVTTVSGAGNGQVFSNAINLIGRPSGTYQAVVKIGRSGNVSDTARYVIIVRVNI